MSVQRFDSYGYMPNPEGKNMRYADHARIVAEAGAAVFAFHPEWTVTGMCDPDCLACRRLTELITERSAGYEHGKADAEQAHAAALAEATRESAAHHYRMGKARGADLALNYDDRPDYKWDQEEVDDLRRQGYERGLADARAAVDAVGRWRSFPDDTLLSRAAVLAAIDALIHDGEATPQVKPCSTCGEPVAYLTARPGWAGGWLHHPARPLDGHPAAIDEEATT